jgi:hypothetical protein
LRFGERNCKRLGDVHHKSQRAGGGQECKTPQSASIDFQNLDVGDDLRRSLSNGVGGNEYGYEEK